MSAGKPVRVGEEVVVTSGAYAGERGTVVALDEPLVTLELTLFGRATRMAFDASSVSAAVGDPRVAFRAELENHFARSAREDTVRWFAARDADEDPVETDELACLYQIASPIRREYLRVIDEFEEALSDAATAGDPELARRRWAERKAGWLTRLTCEPLDPETRARGEALMARVRAALPGDDDDVN